MESYWNKKRISLLINADSQTLDEWLDQHIDTLYTWQYFQIGADVEIAADLTARTFIGAMQELGQYNPDSQSMSQWLREQAAAARDEGLLHWQMKPQRPWAWSQIPDNILCGLSLLRNEPLGEEVPNNPFVQEMVQAALAEMDQVNRLLMMHRYNHLDTPEHIADEIGISIEEVDNRLYRCRHFFRKVFVQLIQSENPGFAEPAASGTLELLDTNLEKLLSATDMQQKVSEKHHAIIREKLLEAAQDVAQTQKERIRKKPSLVAIFAGAVILLLIGVIIWINPFSSKPAIEPNPQPAPTASTQQTTSTTAKKGLEEKIDEEELKRVFLLGQAGDLLGLYEMLKDGQFTSQLAAASFVGKLGDESAISLLEEVEAKWYPNGPDENPFAEAILQIEERLLAEQTVAVKEPTEPETPTPSEAPKKADPTIAGTVMDDSGRPASNTSIILSENPLYQDAAAIRTVDKTQTDNEGQYQFSTPPAGAFFLSCGPLTGSNLTITQSVWHERDGKTQINFGGNPVVSGTLNLEPDPAGEQILYLSNTLDPADASFHAETITDTDGQFSFFGIAPGSYYLLNNTETNRIMWLRSIDISQQDVLDWQVDIQRAALMVQFESTENTPAPSAVSLTYDPDASQEMYRFMLEQQDDGTYSLENIPFGSYTLIAELENGMRLQQPLELNSDRTLTITVPEGNAALSGTFSEQSPFDLFLYNPDQRLRFNLLPDADGYYSMESIPPGTYSLATVVHNLYLDVLEIDLESNAEETLDINIRELFGDLSPLYVVVTDTKGVMVNGAQVWVTGPGDVATTQSTGKGAFLALRPGKYTLYAALPGFATAEQPIQVKPALLQSPDNTVRLQLGTGKDTQP